MKMKLTEMPDDELIRLTFRFLREFSRRLRSGERARPDIECPAQMALPPAVNSARQLIAESLRAGKRPGQPVEVLRLLSSSGRAEKMSRIIAHMQRQGYKGKTFYDSCNALAEVGYAERCFVGTEKAWKITPAGVAWLNRGDGGSGKRGTVGRPGS